MATNLTDIIKKVRTALRGEEVRGSIADGLEFCGQVVEGERDSAKAAADRAEAAAKNAEAAATQGVLNAVDPTLTLSGKAADAKATGAAVDKLEGKKADKTDLDVERKRIDTLNEGGLNLKDEVIDTSIKAWLTEHPEATTTVQDGAITEKKINTKFLPYIIKDYVTPEMFGAVGDGTADDTEYIQNAVNYAIEKKKEIHLEKVYKTTAPIKIEAASIFLKGEHSSIKYDGFESAILLKHVTDSDIVFGVITADNGNCIEMQSTSNADYCQYINISAISLKCKEKCLFFNRTGGWINEIRISKAMLARGNFGVYADGGTDKKYQSNINGIRLINIGIEGVTTGFYLKSGCRFWSISAIRSQESFTNLFETAGYVNSITFYGCDVVGSDKISCSEDTTDFVIYGPVTIAGDKEYNMGVIQNGILYASSVNSTSYIENSIIRPVTAETAEISITVPISGGYWYSGWIQYGLDHINFLYTSNSKTGVIDSGYLIEVTALDTIKITKKSGTFKAYIAGVCSVTKLGTRTTAE